VTFYFKNVIAFLNLALAAFVIASVAARFVFPPSAWRARALVLKGAPLPLAPPLVGEVLGRRSCRSAASAELLVLATNSYLQVMPFMMWLVGRDARGMVFAIVALALAVGAAYPNLDADNAARVAAGAGGLVFMVLCMSFIGVVVMLEAWPVYAIFSAASAARRSTGIWASIAASFGASSPPIGRSVLVAVRSGIEPGDRP
jgi:ABC-2 type transport system permease protein